ncbi:MAG: hypothetical protein WB947_04285 [Thermoplasmata archaeon]
MDSPTEGPPVIGLPERFDRRLRLGPFASARDALKFLTYAAVGAVLSPFTSAYVWLGVVVLGFAITVYRPDGTGLDDRAASFVRWRFRNLGGSTPLTPSSKFPTTRSGLLGVASGQHVGILRTDCAPTAYLPPIELARRFELFRDLLRSMRGGLGFSVISMPMRSAPVIPTPVDFSRNDQPASTGYAELVTLLCRRRSVRRVHLVLSTEEGGPRGISDLELRLSSLTERLAGLGLRVTRLRNRALVDAARRWGWSSGPPER